MELAGWGGSVVELAGWGGSVVELAGWGGSVVELAGWGGSVVDCSLLWWSWGDGGGRSAGREGASPVGGGDALLGGVV